MEHTSSSGQASGPVERTDSLGAVLGTFTEPDESSDKSIQMHFAFGWQALGWSDLTDGLVPQISASTDPVSWIYTWRTKDFETARDGWPG